MYAEAELYTKEPNNSYAQMWIHLRLCIMAIERVQRPFKFMENKRSQDSIP